MHLIRRTTCRVCNSSALTQVIDLGEQYLQGSFVKPGRQLPPHAAGADLARPLRSDARREGLRPPADGVHGPARGPLLGLLVPVGHQRDDARPPGGHRRGGGGAARQADARACSTSAATTARCSALTRRRSSKFGIDPVGPRAARCRADITVVRDLFPSEELIAVLGGEALRRRHVDRDVLRPRGSDRVRRARSSGARARRPLVLRDVVHADDAASMTSYDTICHEHLEYYSLAVHRAHPRAQADLQARQRRRSTRSTAARSAATPPTPRTSATRRDEFTPDIKRAAAGGVRSRARHRQAVPALPGARQRPPRGARRRCSRSCAAEGKRIHVYGASTKGNTILQWCGIDNRLVDVAAERNPDKYGARTLGTDIPIVSEEESRKAQPDYYLVLPWHFRDGVPRAREGDARRGRRHDLPAADDRDRAQRIGQSWSKNRTNFPAI